MIKAITLKSNKNQIIQGQIEIMEKSAQKQQYFMIVSIIVIKIMNNKVLHEIFTKKTINKIILNNKNKNKRIRSKIHH